MKAIGIIIVLFFFSSSFFGQSKGTISDTLTKTRINIKHADKLYRDPSISKAQILKGNVLFEHQGALMNCDSALLFLESNSFEAYGNIHVNQGDTISITGDSLLYFGNTKTSELHGNILMKDRDIQLRTNALMYDLNTAIGTYTTGATIKSTEHKNTLTSQTGIYDSHTRTLFFKDSVHLFNNDYTIDSDTLVYETETEVSHFHGPTFIRSDQNLIYCEHGWYDSHNEKSSFWQNTYIETKDQRLNGDSIHYNRTDGIGEAFGNVLLLDTTNKISIQGDYAYHDETSDSSMVTGHTLFTQFEKSDTLYLRADTLSIKTDSIDSVTNHQKLKGFYHVLIYKNDLQAKCDSLSYDDADSLMKFFGTPIIWSDNNQLSGEYIELKTKEGEINSLLINKSAMIISEVDSIHFDQVKGKVITGNFQENALTNVFVEGNGETIYFLGEDKKPVTDVNQSESASISITFKNAEINQIKFVNDPKATMQAITSVNKDALYLQGFKWEIDYRPTSKKDLLNF